MCNQMKLLWDDQFSSFYYILDKMKLFWDDQFSSFDYK